MRNQPEGRRKWPRHGLSLLIRVGIAGGILAAVGIFIQACGKVGTNSAPQSAALVTNKPPTNSLIWLTDNATNEGAKDTNGLSCVLRISNNHYIVGDDPPILLIGVDTTSAATLTCWAADPSSYLKIDLLDLNGIEVTRTKEGEKYAQLLPLIPVRERIKHESAIYGAGKVRTDGFARISSTFHDIPFAHLGLNELFDVKQPGDYILKVQMRLVEQVGITYTMDPPLQFLLLPEVRANIQLRSGGLRD
jgi:hypothetical protein